MLLAAPLDPRQPLRPLGRMCLRNGGIFSSGGNVFDAQRAKRREKQSLCVTFLNGVEYTVDMGVRYLVARLLRNVFLSQDSARGVALAHLPSIGIHIPFTQHARVVKT